MGSPAPEAPGYEQYFPNKDSIYIEEGYGADSYYQWNSSFGGRKIK